MHLPRLTLLPLLMLTACHPGYVVETASALRVDPLRVPPHLGAICVLRPGSFGWAAAVRHYDNGHLVGVTQGGHQFFCYPVQPGAHQLVARTDDDTGLTLHVRPGEAQHVVVRIRLGPESLERADPGWALRALPDLRPVVARTTGPDVPALIATPVPALPAVQ